MTMFVVPLHSDLLSSRLLCVHTVGHTVGHTVEQCYTQIREADEGKTLHPSKTPSSRNRKRTSKQKRARSSNREDSEFK